MTQNISVVNSKFVMKVGAMAYVVDNFSPESDMWAVDDIETGEIQRTPDGKIVKFTKQAVINAHITLNGASDLAMVLGQLAQRQIRQGNRLAVIPDITVIIENDGVIRTYSEGILQSGAPDTTFGNEKLADRTFNFQFGSVSVMGVMPLVV
jgi:hypothetical protein